MDTEKNKSGGKIRALAAEAGGLGVCYILWDDESHFDLDLIYKLPPSRRPPGDSGSGMANSDAGSCN